MRIQGTSPKTARGRVVVVGGGAAGLAAATSLAERGREVLLLEARPAAGGRARSFTDRETEDPIDNGQHALMGCYHAFLALLSRIGTRHALWGGDLAVPLCDLALADPAARTRTLAAPAWPAPLHFAGAILRYGHLSWRERVSALLVGRLLAAPLAGRDSRRGGQTAL